MNYNDLYEMFRKEKYSETLQQLSKNFLSEFAEYLNELKNQVSSDGDIFGKSSNNNKVLENSVSIFKSLILRRKKKLLNLVFVAAETGIMKRDYENMLEFEKKIFDKFVLAFEEGDKELTKMLNGERAKKEENNKLVIINEIIEQFIDMHGNFVGPFSAGDLVNLDLEICDILVSGGKASYVDD